MGAANLRQRRLVPEILDQLEAEDSRAVRSRGDLARINAVMLQSTIAARLLRRSVDAPPHRILELGAGDGAFSLAVARRLAPIWPGVTLTLLDRKDAVGASRRQALAALGWTVEVVLADVFEWMAGVPDRQFDAIFTNLFLHHFEDGRLVGLFDRLAHLAPTFVATEPRRNGVALAGSRLLWALGANDVSRHDAQASVRAGFCGRELTALWPENWGGRLSESRMGPFTHAFVAAPRL